MNRVRLPLLLLVALAGVVLGTGAWRRDRSATVAGALGLAFGGAALAFYRDRSADYNRGYQDGRADERSDAEGWGCRRDT